MIHDPRIHDPTMHDSCINNSNKLKLCRENYVTGKINFENLLGALVLEKPLIKTCKKSAILGNDTCKLYEKIFTVSWRYVLTVICV